MQTWITSKQESDAQNYVTDENFSEQTLPINFYGDHDFIFKMTSENIIIKKFSGRINFERMRQNDLICYFFFSLWFTFFIMLPTLCVLYICFIFHMKKKYIVQIIMYASIFLSNYFLIKCIMSLFIGLQIV